MVLGKSSPAALRMAARAVEANAEQIGGSTGATCDEARQIIVNLEAWLEREGYPRDQWFPLSREVVTCFVADTVSASKALNKEAVRGRALKALKLTRDKFGLPVLPDVDLLSLRMRAAKRAPAKTAPDLPLRIAVRAEEGAAVKIRPGAMLPKEEGRLRVHQHYDRSFVMLVLFGCRFGNFLSVCELATELVGGRRCVVEKWISRMAARAACAASLWGATRRPIPGWQSTWWRSTRVVPSPRCSGVAAPVGARCHSISATAADRPGRAGGLLGQRGEGLG